MRKIVLYIATSIDGFIARSNGEIDWLSVVEEPGNDYGYSEFLKTIDTTLMGNKTYQQVLTFGEFPYKDKTNYVYTRNPSLHQDPYAQFIHEDIATHVGRIKQQPGSDIWLIGGAQLNREVYDAGLIDEMIISIIPVAIGAGIPLFGHASKEHHFTLAESQSFASGLVQMRYVAKRS